jgi:chitin disaccharide deacetylase
MRKLIVNADDFGQSSGINRGIIEAHEKGIVTSASLMVRWPGVYEAAGYARRHPELSVGLHVDLAEWKFSDGVWTKLYEVVPASEGAAVQCEVERQLDAFRNLMACDPTHLDSHQHLHEDDPLRSILRRHGEELEIPCRGYCSIQFCGRFYGQTGHGQPFLEGISVEALVKLLITLPSGTTELSCHPGRGVDIDTMYRHERDQETQTLCDPRLRTNLDEEQIVLSSFKDCAVNSAHL